MPSGEWVIWFIGGWKDINPPPNCTHPIEHPHGGSTGVYQSEDLSSDANCTVVYDPPSEIRIGADAKTVQLGANASIKDCGASCCDDPACLAFSFNTFASGAPPICKHKNAAVTPTKGNSCPLVKGLPNCMSGGIPGRVPAPVCNGQSWDKSCGPDMPGPNNDCCGPCGKLHLNA